MTALDETRARCDRILAEVERAKFSAHALDGEDKTRAIEALESVRDELRDAVAVVAEQAPAPA